MLLRENYIIYKESNNLYFKNLFVSSGATLVSAIGAYDLLDCVIGKSQHLFLTNNYNFISHCYSTSQQEVSSNCFSYYQSIKNTQNTVLKPTYVNSNFSTDEWWNILKNHIIDYCYFSNSFNFLTSAINNSSTIFKNIKNIYKKGEILPENTKFAKTQYWITVPVGTSTCSSIDYNIIPLKCNENINGIVGEKQYIKFNNDHENISLIFSLSAYPTEIKENIEFKWYDYFKEENINNVEFLNATNGSFSGNSDIIINKTKQQSAWFLNYANSSLWVNLATNQPSGIVLNTDDVLVYKKFDNDAYSALSSNILDEDLLGYLDENQKGTYSFLQM